MTKTHTPKQPKNAPKKVFTSDRSWQGKNILTGEVAEQKHGEATLGTSWNNVRYERDGHQWVMYRDNVEVSRWNEAAEAGSNKSNAQDNE